MKIITESKEKPTGKSIMLFSGGMDSLMATLILKPDILLYIAHDNKYREQEEEAIKALENAGAIPKVKTVVPFNHLGGYERDDGIIPNRNLYFVTYASHLGETIYLGSMLGDRSNDKSELFFELVTKLLNHMWEEQHWCRERNYKITAPFKHITKAELVTTYLHEGHDPEYLLLSRSCYETTKKPCGWCKPCFRKWVALEWNEINTQNYFEKNPWEAPWIHGVLELIHAGMYRCAEEDAETYQVLRAYGY